MSRLVESSPRTQVGGSNLASFETVEVHAAYHARYLRVGGERAYEVGNGCGTCEFWFTRLEGATTNVKVEETRDALAAGIPALSSRAVDQFMRVLADGEYQVLLLDVLPKAVDPTDREGYFWKEQVDLWGLDGFWGLPHYPHVPYYRLDDTSVDARTTLFEFVVPMYPSTWLNSATLEQYASRLSNAERPTAVSLSVLDVKQPADWGDDTRVTAHWCLAHYLLDGHHKMAAAAANRRPLRVLSFLAVDEGVSSAGDIGRLMDLLE